MRDWRIIVKPLLEQNMFNAKEGELIVDKNTGHITIKHNGKFMSKTKELEARVNALLGLKNELVKKFIELADELEILVSGFDKLKNDAREVKETAEELYNELIEIELAIKSLMTQVDRFCLEIKEFQYKELRRYLDPIIANLRELLKLRAIVDELKFLANDIKNQKASNMLAVIQLGGSYGDNNGVDCGCGCENCICTAPQKN
jgi:chromosome segregation ATPase